MRRSTGEPDGAAARPSPPTRVPAETLALIATRALEARALVPEHAAQVADGLVQTSLRGVDTHGVALLPTYLRELDGGRAVARPVLSWRSSGAASSVLDAGGALGIVAGRAAATEALRLAGEAGCGAVAVRNSNHFGAASIYTLAMASHDIVGLCLSNSDALVVPFRGTRALFGTNPLSVAARGAGEDLFCVDMATSQSSYSRIRQRRQRGEPIEPGWAARADGHDVCTGGAAGDADIAGLLPLGGHKGQCLSMLVELLSAFLGGTPADHELPPLYEPPYDTPRRVAHMLVAFDVARFTEVDVFRRRVSLWLAAVREQRGVDGAPVLAPGDIEAAIARERTRDGIPIDAALLRELRGVAREVGIEF